MEREIAQCILKVVMSCSSELNSSVAVVLASSEAAEAEAYRRAVTKVLGEMFTEIILAVYRESPDLLPDELK